MVTSGEQYMWSLERKSELSSLSPSPRLVGYEVLRRWLGKRLSLGSLTSQNALMAAVFASRLLPFLSFDLVSYAAGLTPLTSWRSALATLAGIILASFPLNIPF